MHILITSVIDLQKTSYSRLHRFIEHLLGNGHKITVISIRDNWKHKGISQNEELVKKVKVIYITDRDFGVVRQKIGAAFAAKRLLKQAEGEGPGKPGMDSYGKIDVHFCYNSLILGYSITKELKKRGLNTVYDLADDLPEMIRASPHIPKMLRPFGGKVGEIMLQKSLKLSKAVTYTAREFEKTMGINRFNSFLIPNGVDITRFKPGNDKHSGIIVGYVGALREWVDLRPMLFAVKSLHDKKQNVRALVVGGEEDLQQYRDFAKQHGMETIVEFTGNVPYKDVQKYVKRMDICTVPFKKNKVTDGTNPLKLLEYLACEKPAIVSRLNEPRSMLGDRILYADTAQEWEECILRLMDRKLRDKMGKDARRIIVKEYNWNDICAKMERVLKESA
jgi:glycosyltransferase involved in cell wall biosynthesis